MCGCLPPNKNEGAISGLMSRMSFGKGKAKAAPPKPLENPRPDLVSLENMAADETHPSEHNGVAMINPGEQNLALAQARRHELEKRVKEGTKKMDKGAIPAGDWANLQLKRTVDHTAAFLAPVRYGDKEPFGVYGQGDCAVYSGSGVRGEFAAGECVKGNGYSGLCAVGSGATILGAIRLSSIMQGGSQLSEQEKLAYGSSMTVGCGGGGYGGGG